MENMLSHWLELKHVPDTEDSGPSTSLTLPVDALLDMSTENLTRPSKETTYQEKTVFLLLMLDAIGTHKEEQWMVHVWQEMLLVLVLLNVQMEELSIQQSENELVLILLLLQMRFVILTVDPLLALLLFQQQELYLTLNQVPQQKQLIFLENQVRLVISFVQTKTDVKFLKQRWVLELLKECMDQHLI